jgi:Transposase DDE domain
MHTPYFPLWRARLAPMGQRVRNLRQQSLLQLDLLLSPFLPPGLLSQADQGPNSRDRVYNVRRTFFGFLYQVLNPDCPCRQIVRQIQALFALHNGGRVDEGTSAYSQARGRLPWDILPRLRCAIAAHTERAAQLWRGLCVKVIDGTGVSLPDTKKNQRAYPQPGGQKPGCGFPLMKLVGVFSLTTGVLLDYAKANKHQHELGLLHRMIDSFKPGDLALADRGFSTYTLMALLWLRKVHSLFRLHHARPKDFRKGKRLGKNDRLLLWRKPDDWQKPRYMAKVLWQLLPKELSVRMVRFTLEIPGYRTKSVTLITTLLDPQLYPAAELAQLYARRWRIELWFRDIKTSMGMEVLRCLSPKMVHKELELFFIAYNLIRCLMAEAAKIHDVSVDRLSFKGTVDSVRQFSVAIAQARSRKKKNQLIARLLQIIAQDQVPERPGRREPRAVKRRPKPYQKLNRPRHAMKEMQHRSKYRKKSCS